MRAIRSEADLIREVTEGKREAKAAFGKDEVYLEKLIERARHVEVQVLGDTHGNAVHLFERDCSIQRRNQKVVERAPGALSVRGAARGACGYALKIARADPTIVGAGTVEFLQDADTGKFYFIEVNPRIQVEHTVTEQVTGIDIVKAQIHMLDGFAIGTPDRRPAQEDIRLNGHALQCRITTEDPGAELHPRLRPHHRLSRRHRLRHPARRRHGLFRRGHHPLLRSAAGKGHRLGADAGRGDRPHDRALREFRIRGVATNLTFLERSSATRASSTIPTRRASSTRRRSCSRR
jgi:pyruvate carboxylase